MLQSLCTSGKWRNVFWHEDMKNAWVSECCFCWSNVESKPFRHIGRPSIADLPAGNISVVNTSSKWQPFLLDWGQGNRSLKTASLLDQRTEFLQAGGWRYMADQKCFILLISTQLPTIDLPVWVVGARLWMLTNMVW